MKSHNHHNRRVLLRVGPGQSHNLTVAFKTNSRSITDLTSERRQRRVPEEKGGEGTALEGSGVVSEDPDEMSKVEDRLKFWCGI